MSRFEHVINVDAPVREVYNQWTQFESFPSFMDGVEKVVQGDDRTLEWTASIAGQRAELDRRITDQTPDTRVAWKSTSGAETPGPSCSSQPTMAETKVTLRMDVDPKGFIENVGDKIGAVDRQVKGDLERFKDVHGDTRSCDRRMARRDPWRRGPRSGAGGTAHERRRRRVRTGNDAAP